MKKVEDIFIRAERKRMTLDEKAKMRGTLAAFADARPIPSGVSVPSPYLPLAGGGWSGTIFAFRTQYVQAFLVILLAAGGLTSAAAEHSLPGDPLYAIKVNFNEKMTAATALSPEAKAYREADLASRRLKEAASLSAQGRLTPEVRTQIEANLEDHVENIAMQVKKLASDDEVRRAVEVNAELETTLRVHEKVMLDLSDGSDEAEKVATTIHEELSAVSKSRDRLEDKIGNEVSVEAERQAREKSAEAADLMARANAAIEASKGVARLGAIAEAERHTARSKRRFDDGTKKLSDGQYNRAFLLFQDSIRYSNEALLTLEASSELKIDIVPHASDDSDEGEDETATSTDSDDRNNQDSADDEGSEEDKAGTSTPSETGDETGDSATTTATSTISGQATGTVSFEADDGFPNEEALREEASASRSRLREILKLRF